ncbi:MAG: hypothetical protein GXP62_05070 [Oligoflexia bacterium]|nr:hypothetical protein [Oligoflexia bacterium]
MLSYLGLPDEIAPHLDYYYLGLWADLSELCGTGEPVSGCFKPPTDIYSTVPLDRHELLHHLVWTVGVPPSFFQEGLAEFLSPNPTNYHDSVEHRGDVVGMVVGDVEVDYDIAESFVAQLVRTGGVEVFMNFYSAFSDIEQRQDAATVFETAYGQSLEEASQEWTEVGASIRGEDSVYLFECSRTEVAMSDSVPVVMDNIVMDCSETRLDTNYVDGVSGQYRTLDVGGRSIGIGIESDATAGFVLQSCDGYSPLRPSAAVGGGVWPEFGRVTIDSMDDFQSLYVWEIDDADVVGSTSLTIETEEATFAETCADAGSVTLGADAFRVKLYGAAGAAGAVYAWVDSTEDAIVKVSAAAERDSDGGTGQVSVLDCGENCEELACSDDFWDAMSLFGSPTLTLTGGQRRLLKVTATPGSELMLELESL